MSRIHSIFVGDGGRIRTGWRLALAYLLYRLVVFLLRPLLGAMLGSGFEPVALLKAKSVQLTAIVVTTVLLAVLERRSLAAYGVPIDRRVPRRLASGALLGVGAFTLLIALLWVAGAFNLGALVLSPRDVLIDGVLWAASYLVVGAQEELLFRGYLQQTTAGGIGFWPAAAFTSALFVLAHVGNQGESAAGLAAVFVIGLLFCALLYRTGTLWLPIGFHAGWDFAESFLYSVPNSGLYIEGHLLSARLTGPDWLTGGAAGPEGSAFCILLAVVATVMLATRSPRRLSRP